MGFDSRGATPLLFLATIGALGQIAESVPMEEPRCKHLIQAVEICIPVFLKFATSMDSYNARAKIRNRVGERGTLPYGFLGACPVSGVFSAGEAKVLCKNPMGVSYSPTHFYDVRPSSRWRGLWVRRSPKLERVFGRRLST